MSWILRHKRKLVVFVILITFILFNLLIPVHWYVKIGVLILIILGWVFNKYVYLHILKSYEPFSNQSNIRNIDYLIIGDYVDASTIVPNGLNYIQLSAPDRGYNSSWQLLRHTHSILKEIGGNVVIVVGNGRKDFLVFDLPILHRITIDMYGLKNLYKMRTFPLLIAPISSFKFLFFHKNKRYIPIDNPPEELVLFCKERQYNLMYYRVESDK